MANNRVELATLPRHIREVPGKTSASGLLLSTDLIAFSFENIPAATTFAMGLGQTDRLAAGVLALINDGDPNQGGDQVGLYRYVRGGALANDSWQLIGAAGFDVTSADGADVDGTTLRTYTFRISNMDETPTIPIATWAQDATTQIPRAKLPDTTYGDQYFFPTVGDRNARTNAEDADGMAITAGNIVWHQNDIAIVGTGGSRQAFVYIGTNQTSSANTNDSDWLQLGQTILLAANHIYFDVTNRPAAPEPVNVIGDANGTFTLSTSSGDDVITLSSGISLPGQFALSVNGVTFTNTLDYTVSGNAITFTEFTFGAASTDSVYIVGSTLT